MGIGDGYRSLPRHALYLLPNAFTTAALFCGFYAIFQAMDGHWELVALSVLVAALLDACDGRVARLTGTESSFGVEYDSLSDMVAFGVAPAVLLFEWSLNAIGKVGFTAAFCYCAATAMRLARFNSQSGTGDRKYFIGIPCPAAAVLMVSFVVCMEKYELATPPFLALGLCVILAFTMVSPVRFYSFKTLNLRTRRPLYAGMVPVFGIMLLYMYANNLFLLIFIGLIIYLVMGYLLAGWILTTRCLRRILHNGH